MINQGNNVPDKTIALFTNSEIPTISPERLLSVVEKPSFKRDWFDPHFYHCLPLSVANQYGFIIKTEYGFYLEWNGNNGINDLQISIEGKKEDVNNMFPHIASHFGHGILTVNVPFVLRTPPNVNLLITSPFNYLMPGITVMSGVVETDNLRHHFTFNLKVNIPNSKIYFPPNTPLASFMPIPRYFADSFELRYAEDVFDEDTIIEELQATADFSIRRWDIDQENIPHKVNKMYKKGMDIYGNLFPDHQMISRKTNGNNL